MSNDSIVYVSLLDEAVDVWKPMKAKHISNTHYQIADSPDETDYDSLEFKPGEVVRCEERKLSDGLVLVAVEACGEKPGQAPV